MNLKLIYKIPGPILVTMGAFFLSYGGLLVKSFERKPVFVSGINKVLFLTLTYSHFARSNSPCLIVVSIEKTKAFSR